MKNTGTNQAAPMMPMTSKLTRAANATANEGEGRKGRVPRQPVARPQSANEYAPFSARPLYTASAARPDCFTCLENNSGWPARAAYSV